MTHCEIVCFLCNFRENKRTVSIGAAWEFVARKKLVDFVLMARGRETCTELGVSLKNLDLRFLLYGIIFWGSLVEGLVPVNLMDYSL
ncbi:hypothetical protein LOK49_LG11G02093 [Camellia lanceoleosa]|uniref:Uncharacterized protein n=1 Tax=Camellia lanceoleosa TaxID=1840588 RepID=A0ACC0G2H9_9ERIC|nr:hypothetical protein LOK49_LG11G02093 [Camellia lanceoleosa]